MGSAEASVHASGTSASGGQASPGCGFPSTLTKGLRSKLLQLTTCNVASVVLIDLL